MLWLDTIYGNLGIVFFIVIAGITALAVIRSVIKMKKRKAINITPVGVFNDLPESVRSHIEEAKKNYKYLNFKVSLV